MTCLTCGALKDFSEHRSDSESSTRPAAFDRLERLGNSFDWSEACRCGECGAIFEWYRDRDSDTGITSESVTRCEGERAVTVLCAALAWPWPIAKPPAVLEGLRARLTASVDELGAIERWKPAHLARLELLGLAARALATRLSAHVDDELGARALAAMGAFEVLDDAAKQGHRAALRALARSGPPSCEATLIAALRRTSDTLASAEAAWGLGRLGLGADVLGEVLRTAQDSHVMNACRSALAAMGATTALLAALDDKDWSVQRAGAEGLGLTASTPQSVDALRRVVTAPGRHLIVRTSALRSLLSLGSSRDELMGLVRELEANGSAESGHAAKRCAEALG